LIAAAAVFALPATASADTVTFTAPATGANQGSGGPNQFSLDHHDAYTWRIGGVNLAGQTITSATLTIRNISNWDSNANRLFIHLLDTARNAGVASFQERPRAKRRSPISTTTLPARVIRTILWSDRRRKTHF
jgi:hypothetical protein